MLDRYVNISGGGDDGVEWWPWNTLHDILTRPLIEVEMLCGKYGDSVSVLDLEHVVNTLRDTFVYSTSPTVASTQSSIKDMTRFTTVMDWVVFLQDKLFSVLRSELKLYIARSGSPLKGDTIHDVLRSITLDDEGTPLADKFYADLHHICELPMDDIYRDLGGKPDAETIGCLDDTIRIDMDEQEVRRQMSALLGIAKWNALVMDSIAKKEVLHDVFASSAMLAEYISSLRTNEKQTPTYPTPQ